MNDASSSARQKAASRLWRGLRVRTRLLIAFSVLLGATLAIALVGWAGLSNTGTALSQFEEQALPDISRSLELAERTANLAAVAPYVANASSPFLLQGESQNLRDRIAKVLALAGAIPQLDAAAPRLQTLLLQLERTVNDLVELTRQRLFLREDLRQSEYQLGTLASRYGEDPQHAPVVQLAERLMLAAQVNNPAELDLLQQRYGSALALLKTGAYDQVAVDQLERIGSGEGNLFQLRMNQLELEQRSAFLLASTRAISEQLSTEVGRFVDHVESRIEQQSRRVGIAVASGKSGILIITLLGITVALGGIWVVRLLARDLGAVTGLMTRLAAGDTDQQTPAVERIDEIGDLARAFQVFRENAVEIARISQSLREQSRLLETVFNNINDGLSVFDGEGRLLAWNPRYAEILSLPADKLEPGATLEQVQELLAEEARDSWALDGVALDRDELNSLRRERVQRFERHFADGRIVEFRSSPLPGGGFVTLYSDLTERKAIEEQLRQSQKMEVLGQLTGGVAHDFNNLLAAIIGNLQLLETRLEPDSKAVNNARRALAAAERGGGLTQRLLAFARKQRLQPETIDVDRLIGEMLDLIEYSVGPAIEIDLTLNATPWLVNVDPGQLENALLNLAINSAAAMPEGGKLRFETCHVDNAGLESGDEAVLVRVQDTGAGISETHLARVFEPFFTTKEVGEGSGLGLSMVYGFVKQSQGDIRIHSQLGEGTRIDILLPRVTDLRPQEHDQDDQGALPSGRGEWVLLVEDDQPVRDMAEDMLDSLGYRVESVVSIEAAYTALTERTDFALVFTDINLGTAENGLHLARDVAEMLPGLPVLLTSGLPADQLSSRYGLPVGQFVLAKPYHREALARAVSDALANTENKES
ncbi:PAS-domain containing protein [Marinobacterium sp. D7]|uniref:PAS-domain containing protein n=1 Tax=Marinobacterium ramblicola TaxID=2849041 RepID=UPI001C2D317D|nr:PAS-domain containing protein [Marinobacterium ramblicola]MBV1787681.1 PAS-domain containing protein [Marinobacterium ramblicola]